MGLERGWITDPAIWVDWSYSAARNAQIKAAGNGVVPQQADLAVTNLLPFVPRWVLERLGVEAVAA